MPEVPLSVQRELELRYDGPIPRQFRETAQTACRRTRGTIAVLETQFAQFLDQAMRCESEREDAAADLAERSLSAWQREQLEKQQESLEMRSNNQIANAARMLGEAAALRKVLSLPPHAFVRLAGLLRE